MEWTDVQYERKNIIGRGSFGDVYWGTCRGSTVALKVLQAKSNFQHLAEIRHEIEMLSKLKHQNVVVWMGLVQGGGKYGILMSLEKCSLKAVLYKMGPLETLKKWKYSIDICRGMCWLDSQNIFHRDLKPDNILISESGDCRITDFGLSRILESYEFVSDKTGSEPWMAPEVLLRKNITNKADVYAFALIVWQIFTQEPLFNDLNTYSFKDMIVNGHRPSLSSLPPRATLLQEIIGEGWHDDPQQRPTFPELLRKLETALHEAYLKEFPCGLQFWGNHFNGLAFVPWTEFFNKLKGNCTCVSSLKEDILKHYFGVVDSTPIVTIERFRFFLSWFEDLKVFSSEPRVLLPFKVLSDALNTGWLGGIIDYETAVCRLNLVPDQTTTFIVRVNNGQTGWNPFKFPFVLCTRKSTGEVTQARISYDEKLNEFGVVIENEPHKHKRVPITTFIETLQTAINGEPVGKFLSAPISSFYTST
uniref:Protein kinase domain-containing protein n=1 Tax=Arcella intermedia TaxID=1963864 RepID=A0A6B2L3B3_9EUKA